MRTAIVAGIRTPFAKSGSVFADHTAIDLGKAAVEGLVARSGVDPDAVDQLVYGTVVHDTQAPNIAREVGLATLPRSVPAYTVSRACTSSNQAIADGVGIIHQGHGHIVVAGGADVLSRVPITVSERLSKRLVTAAKAKTFGQRVGAFKGFRPKELIPVQPAIAEPTTGETMGESAERMAKENGISREDQDAWALRSHRLAWEGTEDGRLLEEIVPVYVGRDFDTVVDRDNGIRPDTSLEALAKLRPVFDRRYGSVTAGNASPLTDGASAVLLMSEEAVRTHGLQPLAWIRGYAFTALDPHQQLLQGPYYAAPLALERAGVQMEDIGLMEMHEAFAAQVLSNLRWWESDEIAERELGRSSAVGHPPEDVINVMGGSIAIGHPFGATGARVTTTLVREMQRRDVELGLITVCAAGALGFAMVVERA